MPQTPPPGYQRVIPYLIYQDAPAAIEFLTRAFGFEERMRMPMPDGKVGHAELTCGDDVIMLASECPEAGAQSPRALGGATCQIMCYVDGVDAHHDRAKAAGATITEGLTDKFYGDRTYAAQDPEGNRWYFATHVKDVSPEEMEQAMKEMAG